MKVLKNMFFKPVFLLVSFLLLNFSVMADAARVKEAAGTEQSSIKKSELLESKGIIEPAIELLNGSNFQQNSSFFKKNSSPQANLELKASLTAHFYSLNCDFFHHISSVPLYLFNRSILI
ncbi:MAG: hypothetical protein JWP12_1565 [Bacteroidetes bacterium]|nr:hypothetical protein [Bacteroidota bacterium]